MASPPGEDIGTTLHSARKRAECKVVPADLSMSEFPADQSQSLDAPTRSQTMAGRDFEANSQAEMFGFELWDCGSKVFVQANRGIRFQRRIGKLLQTVSEAHVECAKKITKALERSEVCMTNYSHPSMASSIEGFQGLVRAMRALLLAQTTFAAQSASSGRHIFDTYASMEAEIKTLEKQHKQFERDMRAATSAHSETRTKFLDSVNKHKELKESDKASLDPKITAKIAEKERELKRREAEYQTATQALNEIRDVTNGHSLPSLMKALYCIEEQRIQSMRTAINQFGCLVRNQKIPSKQIGEQMLAASHGIKAMEDLKLYMEAVATNLPAPSDEPVETYDVNSCKLAQVGIQDSEGGVASARDPGVSLASPPKEDPGLLKGLKSMFSGLRKKSEVTADRAAMSVADGGVIAQRRASKIVTKRFYGLSVDNHLTRKYRGYPVPLIAATLMEFVMDMDGPKTQGIFRLSAPSGEMAAARNQIEIEGLESDDAVRKARDAVGGCIVAAVLLKTWLRELPDSIVPQKHYGRCVELASKSVASREGVTQLLQSLPRANLCMLKALALFLRELSESSSVTLMGLDNFAIVFAPCWLRNPSDDPATLLVNTNKEITFAKEALTILSSEEFVVDSA